jgi:hypothetical protein
VPVTYRFLSHSNGFAGIRLLELLKDGSSGFFEVGFYFKHFLFLSPQNSISPLLHSPIFQFCHGKIVILINPSMQKIIFAKWTKLPN